MTEPVDGSLLHVPPAADAGQEAAIRAHPGFRAAMLRSARIGVELYHGNRLLNLVSNDRGRFITALLAMAMHHQPGGLVPARLREIAAEAGLASPGRTRALLSLMQWAGMLAAAPGGRLAPTPKLVELHRARIGRQLGAVAPLLPEATPALARIGEDRVIAGFCLAQAGRFLAGERFRDAAPELGLFVERNAGLLLLFALFLADAGELPPAGVSVAALARRFHVSRPHVALVLRVAGAAGLLQGTTVTPALREAMARFFGAVFRVNAACAVAAVEWADAPG